MNKISAIMFGACALLTFSACSNDDPAIDNGGNGNNVSKGDRVYLAVKISSPDVQGSRAADDSYGYQYGTADENKVTSAHFYFYNAEGEYANIKTSSWTNGTATPNPGDQIGNDKNNIEYTSGGTIILDGLENKAYPKYVVTVLNQDNPDSFTAPATLAGWANLTTWNCTKKETEDGKDVVRYIMTTSSYLGNNDADADLVERTATLGNCYATELKEENFFNETPTREDLDSERCLNIYVERLAARVKVEVGLTVDKILEDGTKLYKTSMSVGGETNPQAKTDLYVKFDKWGLYATANYSRASKSLEEYLKNDKFGNYADGTASAWNWNDPAFYRSYWGKSAAWNNIGIIKASANDGDLQAVVGTDMMYCNENTNAFANIQSTSNFPDPNKATTVLVSATVCKADGTPLPLVEYRGVKYLKDDFIKYIFSITDLPYYTRKVDKVYTPKEGDPITTYTYDQIAVKDVASFEAAGDGETGSIILQVNDGVELWTPGEPSVLEDFELVDGTTAHGVTVYPDAKETTANANEALRAKLTAGGGKAYAYTEGAMVYPIVIEHLNYKLGTDGRKVAEKAVIRDGQIGVVRNHSYLVRITKINNLGMGIYEPGNIPGTGEIIKPKPGTDPTYYVGANINILSWKLVEQDAEI